MKRRSSPALLLGAALCIGAPANAQIAHPPSSAGAELPASRYTSVLTTTQPIPALQREIAIELNDVLLSTALAQIAARANLRLTYSQDILPTRPRVTLSARRITAARALAEVLRGYDLDVLVSRDLDATVVRLTPSPHRP